jgi:hypothetical protein
LIQYLAQPARRQKLEARTCVTKPTGGRPWYAFHERPVLRQLQQPKILCKDVTATPAFVADRAGDIVPRHSVYYIIPKRPELLDPLLAWLRSDASRIWLNGNCQRVANGFLRLQSHVLRNLPIPEALAESATVPGGQAVLAGSA